MRKQLIISIMTVLSVLLFISETPADKGTGDLTQIPDAIYKEIVIKKKKLCFITDEDQCLRRVTCDENRDPVDPAKPTLAEFLKIDSIKFSIENHACVTFVIDIKHPQNPCVYSGGRLYC